MTSDTSHDLGAAWAAIASAAARRPVAGWREAAACRQADPELFFPIGSAGPAEVEIQRAKAVCAGCPVHRPCLSYALATGQEFGIWGGRDENERRLLHRQRRESGMPSTRHAYSPEPWPAPSRVLTAYRNP